MNEDEKEQLRLLMKKDMEDEFKKADLFWTQTYSNYSVDERIRYWAGTLRQQMRFQAESGLDEYAMFNKGWYEWVKGKEPDFDTVIETAFKNYLSPDWSYEEFLKRIAQ